MPRESRKSPSRGLASTVNSAVLVCLAVAVAALGRIRLKSEESRMYTEINRLDSQLQELRRSNQKLRVDFEILTSPAGLNARIREMQLNLVMPGDDARVVLPEPNARPGTAAPMVAGTPADPARAILALSGPPASKVRPTP